MDMDISKREVVSGTADEGDGVKKLGKNSVISVTVDDLNEGLIVVSYAHDDNLYQGVLLQLNRERGIPSGISFPKDYCTGSVVEPVGENDPTQVPPLPQRHTYFQESPSTQHDPLKARAALRRVIKPPARFKNSRMSLRLRHRPVLCAKCKTLCEEKNGVSSSSSSTTNSNKDNPEDQDSSKKVATTATSSSESLSSSLPVTGVATRRSKSVESSSSSCNPSSVSSTSTATITTSVKKSDPEVEQDYSFVSIGTKTFVDNYWKRPNPGPEEPPSNNGKERTKGASSTNNGSNGSKEVKVPRLSSRIEARSSGGSETKDSNSSTSTASSLAKENKSVKINGKKSKNIKLCITKTAAGTTDVKTEVTQGGISDEPCSSSTSTLNMVEDDACGAITKDLRTLRKRNTTVPVRFRDQGYVTKKNIFNFKRRRDEDGEEDTDGMPDLTDRSSPLIMEGVSTIDEDALHPPKLSKSSSPEGLLPRIAEESHQEHSTSIAPTVTESPPDGKSVSSGEPQKTPVIKISFGTPGNGVVIQIPPKAKQEEPLLSSSSSTPLDKAVRKAMKKAKKEARRKLSLSSREPSPDLPPTMMTLPILSNCDDIESTALPPPQLPPLTEPSTSSSNNVSELPIIPVLSFKTKKKKEKKKKRDKEMNGALLQSSRENSSSSQADTRSCTSSVLQNHERISPSPSTTENHDATPIEPVIPPLTLSLGSSKSITIMPTEKISSTPLVAAELSPQAPPQRLCISLKRLTENSLGWDIAQNNRNHFNNSNSNHELVESTMESGQSSPGHLEPNDVMETLPDDDENRSNASSLDSYTDERRNYVYKKGDIVWGKLPGCPWWPGKILDILFVGVDDVSARVSWYRASTLSCIRFSQLTPFAEQFEARYTRSRKRGSYQHAVRDALIEAHQLDPNDLPSD